MPTFRTGNMWEVFDEVDHFIITTNAVVKNNGALVMGAGIAKQVRDSFPGIDADMGAAIYKHCGPDCPLKDRFYGILLGRKIGMFQVKHHYKDDADLRLIQQSAGVLDVIATHSPGRTFALNFPGIGNGKLDYHDVYGLISHLPDNVQIWTFK